jgi:N-methylhydantoinase A/oxoprolinase/acetone carboxylase beta subunit
VPVATKASTSPDVTSGIVHALDALLARRTLQPGEAAAVMIGTTHFINAVVAARSLAPRTCGRSSAAESQTSNAASRTNTSSPSSPT